MLFSGIIVDKCWRSSWGMWSTQTWGQDTCCECTCMYTYTKHITFFHTSPIPLSPSFLPVIISLSSSFHCHLLHYPPISGQWSECAPFHSPAGSTVASFSEREYWATCGTCTTTCWSSGAYIHVLYTCMCMPIRWNNLTWTCACIWLVCVLQISLFMYCAI